MSDEYEMFFDGPLTEEEKELVSQLKMRQKADSKFEGSRSPQLEFDQILSCEPEEVDNSDDEFSSLPASVEHGYSNKQMQDDFDNSPDKLYTTEGKNHQNDNLVTDEHPLREQQLKRTFDDFFSREDPLIDEDLDADSASEGSEDEVQLIREREIEKPVKQPSRIKNKGWQETVTQQEPGLMQLDLDPIAKVGGGDFIEKDFEFDDSER